MKNIALILLLILTTSSFGQIHTSNGDIEISKELEFRFEEFTLQMELEGWDLDGKLKEIQKDSSRIYLELGETPEAKEVKITHPKFKKIEVFQRYENSVTITNEGPHCDLTNWKHYYSNWNKLNYNKEENTFITDSYTLEDKEKFIPVAIDDLKKAFEEHCGDNWSEYIKNIRTINEYPSSVATSRIFLKIVLTDENDSQVEKIISFVLAMGG